MKLMSASDSLRIRCPDCESELIVDRETGEILHHRPPSAPPKAARSLDDLMRAERDGRSRAEDIFEREKASLEDRDRLMDEKFRKALEEADDGGEVTRPARPFDLD